MLWQHQTTDLQAQLAQLAAGGDFRLKGIRVLPGTTSLADNQINGWPSTLHRLFGLSSGRHLLLLPLYHNTTRHNTTRHNTTRHNTAQHNTAQHNTAQPLANRQNTAPQQTHDLRKDNPQDNSLHNNGAHN
ncbi:MAG: hypothetical protein AAF703_23635, partial [Cyanobacteria bacterium P01_D01_bin.105]